MPKLSRKMKVAYFFLDMVYKYTKCSGMGVEPSNGRRIAVDSKSNRSCNHRLSNGLVFDSSRGLIIARKRVSHLRDGVARPCTLRSAPSAGAAAADTWGCAGSAWWGTTRTCRTAAGEGCTNAETPATRSPPLYNNNSSSIRNTDQQRCYTVLRACHLFHETISKESQ